MNINGNIINTAQQCSLGAPFFATTWVPSWLPEAPRALLSAKWARVPSLLLSLFSLLFALFSLLFALFSLHPFLFSIN